MSSGVVLAVISPNTKSQNAPYRWQTISLLAQVPDLHTMDPGDDTVRLGHKFFQEAHFRLAQSKSIFSKGWWVQNNFYINITQLNI